MKYVLYSHAGSANHGCEALVRSIAQLLYPNKVVVLSDAPDEDRYYGVDSLVEPIISKGQVKAIDWIKAYYKLKIKHDYHYMDAIPYFPSLDIIQKDDIAISIGGDVYCYDHYLKYIYIDQEVRKRADKTILLGCSIDEDKLEDERLINNLNTFDLITAREHITYNNLINKGLDNVKYYPDSAFLLNTKGTNLPNCFQANNTVGLNISPLVLKKANNPDLILDNYRYLIEYILSNTDYSVALIPHVVWKDNDDRVPLLTLYNEFKNTNRLCMIEDQDAEKLKYIISKCNYFIGARTHATIAAYSSCVPTLVLGYSVKSKGIAEDLFGTYNHYVISYDDIKDKNYLVNAYEYFTLNKYNILCQLGDKMSSLSTLKDSLKEVLQNSEL